MASVRARRAGSCVRPSWYARRYDASITATTRISPAVPRYTGPKAPGREQGGLTHRAPGKQLRGQQGVAEHTGGGSRRGAAQQIDTDHLGGDRAEAQQAEGRQRAAVGEQGQSREVQGEEQRRGGERDSPGGAPPAAELQPRAREREHDQGEQQTAALEAPGQEGADDEDRVGIKAREAREGVLDCLEAERQHRREQQQAFGSDEREPGLQLASGHVHTVRRSAHRSTGCGRRSLARS